MIRNLETQHPFQLLTIIDNGRPISDNIIDNLTENDKLIVGPKLYIGTTPEPQRHQEHCTEFNSVFETKTYFNSLSTLFQIIIYLYL